MRELGILVTGEEPHEGIHGHNTEDLNFDGQSVEMFEAQSGIDYDDPKMKVSKYPPGYDSMDDLDGDGRIDGIEAQLKVAGLAADIKTDLKDGVRDAYLAKFRKEVDFHHKVAYRYERSYRLGKKQPHRKNALNMEIVEIISEHSDYIEADPMALFYCLYFCIYYNNPDLVEFLRTLINKMTLGKKL
jgi:hypothetical protein